MSLALIGWLCLVQGAPLGPEVAARKDEVVAALVKALAGNESFVRNAAASALGEIGPSAAKAIPGLVVAIREPDGSLATASLGKLGPAALPEIIQLIKHEEKEVQQRAILALYEMGPAAKPALPVLWPLVREGDDDVQDYAGYAIDAIAPGARVELTAVLEEGSPVVRIYAAHGLLKADPTDRVAQRVALQALTDSTARVRARAIASLGLVRVDGKPDGAAIRVGLTDPDPLVRGYTIELFGTDPFRSPDVVPALAGALSDEDERVGYRADRALSHYGPEAAVAIPALIKRVSDDVEGKHVEAVVALGKIGRADARVAPVLLKLLERRPDMFVELATGMMGPRVIPDLTATINDGNRSLDVRRAAVGALGHAGPDALPILLKLFDDPRSELRQNALTAFGSMGAGALPAVPLLERIAQDGGEQPADRKVATLALGYIGAGALPAIVRLFDAREPFVRAGAVRAVAMMAPKVSDLIPKLVACLDDRDATVRAAAAHSIDKLGIASPATVAALRRRLDDPDSGVRGNAASALAAFGRDASPAIPRLIELLHDDQPGVRHRAASALGKIAR